MKIFENLVNNEDFWNLIKLEDYSNFGHNRRYLKIRSKLKIFQSLVKIEDFWKLDKIFQILEKKLKKVPMLGFEHPSHMVTHPSTDKAQCCLTLEIFKKRLGKKLLGKSRV